MSMFVLLPDKAEHDKWVHLVYELRTIKLSRFLNCTEKEVKVSMPKFKIQTTMSINNVLKEVCIFFSHRSIEQGSSTSEWMNNKIMVLG